MPVNEPPFKEGDTIKCRHTGKCYIAGALLLSGEWLVDLGEGVGWRFAHDFCKSDESFMVAVPRTPTEAMLRAVGEVDPLDDCSGPDFRAMWKAAIAAWEGSQKKD